MNTPALLTLTRPSWRTAAGRTLVLALAIPIGAASSAQGEFGPYQDITMSATLPTSVHAADLDGDGDPDVLSSSVLDHRIAWCENLGGGVFGPQQVISSTAYQPTCVYSADLDNDGDADVLSTTAADNKVTWYENLGGGAFGPRQVISSTASMATCVHSADLDGDGDEDVLAAAAAGNMVAWYENLGAGSFGPQQVITAAAKGARAVHTADLDGDGDEDVLAASYEDSKVTWYENLGAGTFGPQQVISAAAKGARAVQTADLDGDGDEDVLAAAWFAPRISWYENLGAGTFGPQQVLSSSAWGADVLAADLDGDGDPDVAYPSTAISGGLTWRENQGGGSFGPDQAVDGTGAFVESMHASDLDGDGDADLLAAQMYGKGIGWYENLHQNLTGFPLTANLATISLAEGGAQQFRLEAGPLLGLQPYLLLGSLSGTAPGMGVDGQVLPLIPDSYLVYTLMNPNSAALQGSFGTLAADGSAAATLTVPAGMKPEFAGIVAHHAFLSFDVTSGPSPFVNFVSNPTPLKFFP